MILINGQPVEIEQFPNGEVRIPKHQFDLLRMRPEATEVRLHWESDADLMHLGFVRSAMGRVDAAWTRLVIDYLPYSRMDRQTSDVFTLKYVCSFINSLNFGVVVVTEPHSDVCLALLDRSVAVYPSAEWLLDNAMERMEFNPARDYLFFPDAGAAKRYPELVANWKHMVGHKTRNQADRGAITKYSVSGVPEGREGVKILILDDLCSYGGTFLAAAQALSALNFNHTSLVVTHLEPAFWNGELVYRVGAENEGWLLRDIYTSNSMQSGINEVQTHRAYKHVHFFDVATKQAINNQQQGESA